MADLRTSEPDFATADIVSATHAVVVDTDTIRLVLTLGDEVITRLPLGPADALALASDLLLAARRRLGRAAPTA